MYRDPVVDSSSSLSSFSPLSSSLLLESDDPRRTDRMVVSSSPSSSAQFNLELMKVQLRASQEDLRTTRLQMENLEARQQAELAVYRYRVAELETELQRGGASRDKGKGRGT
jgi:hypothetical protein